MASPPGLERLGFPIFFQNIGFPQRLQAPLYKRSRWMLFGVGNGLSLPCYSGLIFPSNPCFPRKERLSSWNKPPHLLFSGMPLRFGRHILFLYSRRGGRGWASGPLCSHLSTSIPLSFPGIWLSVSTDHCWSASSQPHSLIKSEALCKP